jgi:hypothetical protein
LITDSAVGDDEGRSYTATISRSATDKNRIAVPKTEQNCAETTFSQRDTSRLNPRPNPRLITHSVPNL